MTKYSDTRSAGNSVDFLSFHRLNEGLSVRDCIYISGKDLAILSRVEGPIVDNFVRKGGALNIKEARIGDEVRTYDLKGGENLNQISRLGKGDSDSSKGMGAYGVGAKQISIGTVSVQGRFPANVIVKETGSMLSEQVEFFKEVSDTKETLQYLDNLIRK